MDKLSDLVSFLFLWCALTLFIMGAAFNFDRIIAFALRPLHHRLFPLAHRVARSLRTEPETWDYDRDGSRATHRPSGVVISSGYGHASGVRFVTKVGEWKPNFIARRIVRDALDVVAKAELGNLSASYMEPGSRADQRLLGHDKALGPVDLTKGR